MATVSQDDKTDLEQIIDRYSLQDVLGALAEIARDKGEHLRSNWRDKYAARTWELAARQIDRLDVDV